jgi:undecaprenyl-diphosphatase
MWAWIDRAVDMVAAHPGLALTVAFVGAIVEAVAVLGILIPGTPMVMAAAGAAAMAGQPMVPFLIVAVIGAVIGDFVSFWIGQKYSFRIQSYWPFSRRPGLMANAVRFFDRYGVYSVAVCRFIPILRSTVPLVAGMVGMPRRRFVTTNVLSAFVWAPVHVYPAQIAGISLWKIREGDWQSAVAWGGALVLGVAVLYVIHRRFVPKHAPDNA